MGITKKEVLRRLAAGEPFWKVLSEAYVTPYEPAPNDRFDMEYRNTPLEPRTTIRVKD